MSLQLILIASFSILTVLGCGKTPDQQLNETISADGMLRMSGSFMGYGSEKVSGKANIYFSNNQYMLKLENFSSSNGPDLKVYLSKAASPLEFISLGNLKSTNGNQVYQIMGTPDFLKYHFVLIHCEKYNHLYGSAELMQ